MSQAQTDRLQLDPVSRVIVGAGLAGTFGFANGLLKGSKNTSLQYLAENAHRLPKTKGTWYFFHKRKNYVVLLKGTNKAIAVGSRFALIAASFLGLEAGIDHLRGKIDMLSTVGAAGLLGSALTISKRLSRGQIIRSTLGYMIFGALEGGTQDLIRRKRERDGLTA